MNQKRTIMRLTSVESTPLQWSLHYWVIVMILTSFNDVFLTLCVNAILAPLKDTIVGLEIPVSNAYARGMSRLSHSLHQLCSRNGGQRGPDKQTSNNNADGVHSSPCTQTQTLRIYPPNSVQPSWSQTGNRRPEFRAKSGGRVHWLLWRMRVELPSRYCTMTRWSDT